MSVLGLAADFFDDFEGPGLDRAKWPGIHGGVSIVSGRLELQPLTGYSSVSSSEWFDLTSSQFAIEAVRANLGGTGQSIMTVRTSSGNTLQFICTDGQLVFRMTRGATVTDHQVPYEATAHRWWRVHETGGTARWETSPDGRAWTLRHSASLPFSVAKTHLSLDAGSYGSPASTTTFRVGFVNIEALWDWGQYAIFDDFALMPSMVVDSDWYFGQWYLPPASAPYGGVSIADRTAGEGKVMRIDLQEDEYARLRSWRQRLRDVDFSCDILIHERTAEEPLEWHSPRMLWRMSSTAETYYQVQFGIDGWEIGRFLNGNYTKIGEGRYGLTPGVSYRVRVVHYRNTIVIYRSDGDPTNEENLTSAPMIEMGRTVDNSHDALDQLGWVGFSGASVKFDVSTIRALPSTTPPQGEVSPMMRQRRWGSFAAGSPSDGGTALEDLVTLTGKDFEIASWFQSWDEPWYASEAITTTAGGRRDALVAWEPFNRKTQDIIDGVYDEYIDQFALDIANHPGIVWLRPFHEMNGDWYPWSATYGATYEYEWVSNETSSPAHLAEAWKHVVDRFRALDINNVRWVFNVNAEDVPWDAPFEDYYPGGEYVDAVGIDGYNFGDSPEVWWNWVTFEEIMTQPYNRLVAMAPDKEVWICEFASKEPAKNDGAPADPAHSKATWVRQMMESDKFPALTTLVWFNENKERDWRMNSSPEVLQTFIEQFRMSGDVLPEPFALDLVELEIFDGVEWEPYLCDARDVRVTRGGDPDPVSPSTQVGTLAAIFVNAADPTTDVAVRPNSLVRLVVKNSGVPLFTGRLQDIETTYDHGGNKFIAVTVADGVQSLANTMRYGAVTEGAAGFEPWHERLQRLCRSANTETNPPTAPAPELIWSGVTNSSAGWHLWGSTRSGTSRSVRANPLGYFALRTSTTTSVSFAPGALGVYRSLTGLEPGRQYTFTSQVRSTGVPSSYMAGVPLSSGTQWGPVANVSGPSGGVVEVTFIATATSHQIRISTGASVLSRSGSVGQEIEALSILSANLYLHNPDDPYMMQDVVYESTLANHFSLVQNSVGGRWWVDRNNVVQFSRARQEVPLEAHFSDDHSGTPQSVIIGTRTNLYRNPRSGRALTNTGGFTGESTVTRTTEQSWTGEYSVKAEVNAVNNRCGVRFADHAIIPAGTNVHLSLMVYLDPDNVGTQDWSGLHVQFDGPWQVVLIPPVTPGVWTEVTASVVLDADMTAVRVGFRAMENWAVGDKAYFDAITLSTEPGPPFHGDMPDTPDTTYEWLGTPDSSLSVESKYAVRDVLDPLHTCYTDIEKSFDTRDVVNDLLIINNGRMEDPDQPGNWIATHPEQIWSATSPESVREWGARQEHLEVSIHAPGEELQQRGQEILGALATPRVRVRTVRFNGLQFPQIAQNLDVMSRVKVTREDHVGDYRVLGIRHDMTPTSWDVLLDLTEDTKL